jgi:ribosomal protein S18 acetylase RimI-like enzyme
MNTNIEIQRLTSVSDTRLFREIAQIHQEEITEGFLSTLGIDFLEKLYRVIASSRHAFIFVATLEGQAVGCICGSTNTRLLYKEIILNYGWQMLLLMLPKIFSLSVIIKVKETLCYPQKNKCCDLPSSEILNFCVNNNYQRKGIAKSLFKHLTQEFKRLKINRIKIVTGERQISAQRFYEAMKATRISNISIHTGIVSYVYIYHNI